jgi:ParB family chromosome partitioning protein
MSLKNMSQGRGEVYNLNPADLLVQDGYNVRDHFSSDPEFLSLKESIRVNGVITPLSVKLIDGKVYVRRGHRRMMAIKQLIEEGATESIQTVPCLPAKGDTLEQDLDLILSNDGKPLTSLEQGRAFKRLRDVHNMVPTDISAKTGRSVPHVYNCLKLADSTPKAQMAFATGRVTAQMVLDIMKKHKDVKDDDKRNEKIDESLEKVLVKAQAQGKKKAGRTVQDGPKKPGASKLRKILTDRADYLRKALEQDQNATLPVVNVIELLEKIRDYTPEEKAEETEVEKELEETV